MADQTAPFPLTFMQLKAGDFETRHATFDYYKSFTLWNTL